MAELTNDMTLTERVLEWSDTEDRNVEDGLSKLLSHIFEGMDARFSDDMVGGVQQVTLDAQKQGNVFRMVGRIHVRHVKDAPLGG